MNHQTLFVTLFLIFVAKCDVQADKPNEKLYGSHWLVDCGSSTQSNWSANNFYQWDTDELFIKSGENRFLPTNQNSPQMNTLRFFTKGDKNCYEASFYDGYQNNKYIFRAGFYYGNYDGLSKPPSFGLEIDGFFWANVTTSMSEEPVFYETIYTRKGLKTRVCLVSNGEGDEVPFISTLEGIKLYTFDMYTLMNNQTAFNLHSRINYGANQSVEQSISPTEDPFSRIWKSKEMPNYLNIHSQNIAYDYAINENYPPWKVMDYAIQANNITESLYLPLNFSSNLPSLQAYIVLYFMDPIFYWLPNETCKVEIYIDGVKMATSDVPNGFPGDKYNVVTLFPVVVNGGFANLTISPANGSTLAPILNAMEVYSAFDVSELRALTFFLVKNGGNSLVNLSVMVLVFFLQGLVWFLVL